MGKYKTELKAWGILSEDSISRKNCIYSQDMQGNSDINLILQEFYTEQIFATAENNLCPLL